MKPDLPWWWRTGDALSQLFNAAVLGGSSNESVSGRASRVVRWDDPDHTAWRVTYDTINFIFFMQDNHCDEAYDADLERGRRLLRSHTYRINNAAK